MSDTNERPNEADPIDLLRTLIPEVAAGTTRVRALAYLPGRGLKVAVAASEPWDDALATVIGHQGARVQGIRAAFAVPRVEALVWISDPAMLIRRALAPASVLAVKLTSGHHAEVTVGDSEWDAAHGKDGVNVALAEQLTGWHLTLRRAG